MTATLRTAATIADDLQRERVILGHALHRNDLPGLADTRARIDRLLDELLEQQATTPAP